MSNNMSVYARLDAVEAESKRLGDLVAFLLKDQPQPREPGWYPVWGQGDIRPCLCEWTGKEWVSTYGTRFSDNPTPKTWTIGPRIQEPGK